MIILNKLYVEHITREDFIVKYKNSFYVSDGHSTYYHCLIYESGNIYLAKCKLQYECFGNTYSIADVQFKDTYSIDVFEMFDNTVAKAKPCDKDFITKLVEEAEAIFIAEYVYKRSKE